MTAFDELAFSPNRPGVGFSSGLPKMVTQESLDLPAANGTVDLLNLPPATFGAPPTAGVLEKLKLIGNGSFFQDGWIRISYDNGKTYPFVAEIGSLFLCHPGGSTFVTGGCTGAGPYMAACRHLDTQQAATIGGIFLFQGTLRFPIPYRNGIIVQLFNPTSTDFRGTGPAWYEATIQPCNGHEVPQFRLKTSSSSVFGGTTNNYTINANGFVLKAADTAMNGNNSGTQLSLTPSQVGQLASLTGKGWAVGLSYLAQGSSSTDLTHLERNFGWYIDGATPPVPGGSIVTPTFGVPTGAGVGSPTMLTSGVEDTFDSAFYAFGQTMPSGKVTPPGVPLTTVAVVNRYGVPITVYVNATAAVSDIKINGVTTGIVMTANSNVALRLAPVDSVSFTYASTAPTWTWWASDYAQGGPINTYSKPAAMGMANGQAARELWYSAFLDIMESCGGYRFSTSLQLWLLTESRVTATHIPSWTLLYYEDQT